MPGTPFRFVHASDFHLEKPLAGFWPIPEHLRDLLLDAPLVAAKRVFDTALAEDVQFVVLAGGIIEPLAAGPRGIEFFRRQLARLDERQIAVYWAEGRCDGPHRWPKPIRLPACVHRFSDRRVTTVIHRGGGLPLATIVAGSGEGNRRVCHGQFEVDTGDLYSIAIAHGALERKVLRRRSAVNYWALGGKNAAQKLQSSPSIAQFCGSPQGRQASEEGPHGCLVVEVDQDGKTHRRKIATDIVRWHRQQLELTDAMTRTELEDVLCDHTRQLSESASGRQIFLSWSIIQGASAPAWRLAAQLRQGGVADELTDTLRRRFGMTKPGVWTVGLDVVPPERLPRAWYEEDTILGDLLRLVRHYQEHEDEDPFQQWETGLGREEASSELEAAIKIASPSERRDILRRVAALGVDLLGSKPTSPQP